MQVRVKRQWIDLFCYYRNRGAYIACSCTMTKLSCDSCHVTTAIVFYI
jgi:hypothetical protein